MLDKLAVEELIKRTATGMTEPFVCRLSDDHTYIVKGRGASKRGLISELIAAFIAKQLELPIPDFAIGTVVKSLIDENQEARYSIGQGQVFASKQLFDVVEVDRGMLDNRHTDVLRRIFLFHYWISNVDRTGSEWGGNSNILIHTGTRNVSVIDHNLAFDQSFNIREFVDLHICSDFWFGNPRLYDRQENEASLTLVMNKLEQFISHVPEDWVEGCEDQIDIVRAILARFHSDAFWTGIEP